MSQVIILTGPGGAGKSTTAKVLTQSLPGTWAYIEQDKIRQLVKAGFKDPSLKWDDNTQTQWDVSIKICSDMARRYYKANINCIVDCFAPHGSFTKWQEAFSSLPYAVIKLLPNVNETLRRNSGRVGAAKLNESMVREHHDWFQDSHEVRDILELDTSNMDLEQVVEQIKDYLK